MTQPQTPFVDPLEHTPLHTLLVRTNEMQKIPAIAIAGIMFANTLFLGLVWYSQQNLNAALLVAAAFAITNVADWTLLRALVSTGRSFGPDRPVALALSELRWLIAMIAVIFPFSWAAWLAVVLMAAVSALAYYATWVEPFALGVTTQTFTAPKLRSGPPLRVLHIGDIHVERVTPRERHLNRLVAELQPDMIVFSGDFVNLSNTDDPQSEAAIREIISAWKAPYGVYAVSGTPLVEPMARVQAFVEGTGVKLLKNQWLSIDVPNGRFNLLGLVTTHDMDKDRAMLKKMAALAPSDGINMLLMHTPDIAPEANDSGMIDLYVCGHTHGGQIRLPFYGAIFSSSHLGTKFIMGRYELGKTTLYTMRGVGLEGLGAPRARFLCPPEIVLWEITGTK